MINRNIRLFFKVALFLLLSLGAVVAFSPGNAGLQPNLNDKLLHAVAFFVLSGAYHLAYPAHPFKWSIASLVVYGAVIEIVQSYLPYRQFSLLDLLANIVGIVTYFVVLAPWVYRKLAFGPKGNT